MPERTFIETPRLFARTWRVSDFSDFHAVMSDPLVHRFTSEEPYTEAQTREMIEWNMAHHLGEAPGYFNCPLVLRESGRVIGRVGLNPFGEYRAGETVPEIEWTIGSAYWGRGYATEIGRAMLRYGLEECGFTEIVGFAEPEHVGSCRVMSKIGMRPLGLREARGRQFSFYVISKYRPTQPDIREAQWDSGSACSARARSQARSSRSSGRRVYPTPVPYALGLVARSWRPPAASIADSQPVTLLVPLLQHP